MPGASMLAFSAARLSDSCMQTKQLRQKSKTWCCDQTSCK